MHPKELDKIRQAVFQTLKPQIEKILQGFQQEVVGWQARLNMLWNTMNVYIRVLEQKGLVTEDEFRQAGEELLAEAKANVEKARKSKETGELNLDGYSKSPMDEVEDRMNAIGGAKDAEGQEEARGESTEHSGEGSPCCSA